MPRDEDELDEPDYPCPACRRSFASFASLDDHLAEHEGLKQCKNCGQTIRGPYHRC
jgi:transcription elongation factor Elf1